MSEPTASRSPAVRESDTFELLTAAEGGDAAALKRLRPALRDPYFADAFGNVAAHVEASLGPDIGRCATPG